VDGSLFKISEEMALKNCKKESAVFLSQTMQSVCNTTILSKE